MSSNEQLEQPLWELVYELLSPEEAADLLQRITSDPELARAYAKVKIQAEVVAAAAKCDDSRGTLVRPGEDVASQDDATETEFVVADASSLVRLKSRSGALRLANWLVAAAALGLVVMSAFSLNQLRAPTPRQLTSADTIPTGTVRSSTVRTVVTAPAVWNEDTTNFISVRTASLDGTPIAAPFVLKLYDAAGDVQLQDEFRTNETGAAQVEVAGARAARASRLEVAAGNGASPPLTTSASWVRSGHLTHLTTDLPTYHPGETVSYRSLSLSRFDQRVDGEVAVEFEVLDEQGALIPNTNHVVTSKRGVGDGEFTIPADAAYGKLTVLARSPDGEFPEQRREVLVRTIDDPIWHQERQELLAKASPIPTGRVDVQFFPEGGELAAGLSNRVYFQARDLQGQPIHLEGRIVDDAGHDAARAVTVHEGRGEFTLTTRADVAYQLIVETPAGPEQTLPLPTVSRNAAVVLHTAGQVLEPSDPIDVTLRMRSPDRSLVLAAACRGGLVGLQAIEQSDFTSAADGTSECQRPLTLAPEASGVIRVTVYDSSRVPPAPVAERLVYRRPARRLQVQVDPVDSPRPGQQITLGLQTSDEQGRPVPAALGVSVVNQGILNVANDRSANLETFLFLTSEIPGGDALEDANFFLGTSNEAATAMDLLLGTQGWRRFVEFDIDQVVQAETGEGTAPFADDPVAAIAKNGGYGRFDSYQFDDAEAFPGRSVDQLVPVVLDNRDAIEHERAAPPATVTVLPSQWIRSRESSLRRWGTGLLVGGLLVLVAVAVLAITRALGQRRVWVPSVVMAGIAAVLGIFWMGSQVSPLGDVAYTPASNQVAPTAKSLPNNAGLESDTMPMDAAAPDTRYFFQRPDDSLAAEVAKDAVADRASPASEMERSLIREQAGKQHPSGKSPGSGGPVHSGAASRLRRCNCGRCNCGRCSYGRYSSGRWICGRWVWWRRASWRRRPGGR